MKRAFSSGRAVGPGIAALPNKRRGGRAVAYALTVALVATLAASAGARAFERPRDGWIVFPTETAPEAGGQIVSVPLGAGRQRVLIRGLRDLRALVPSPDGKLIALARGEVNRAHTIWLLRADGSGLRRLTRGSRPTWSPDGRQLVFFGEGLMTIRPDGSDLRQVLDVDVGTSAGVPPVWSPDGGWIAYMTGDHQIVVVRPDGTGAHGVGGYAFDPGDSAEEAFSWSPNGRRLAYVGLTRTRAGAQWDIYTVSVDGVRPRRVTNTPDDKVAPRWSPNGRRIAFVAKGTMVVSADGSAAPRRVTRGIFASWSPDSSKLAVVRPSRKDPEESGAPGSTGNDVWVVHADGRAPRRVSRSRGSFSGVEGRPVWTPNGRRILFLLYADIPGELMMISPASGQRRRLTHNRIQEFEPAWSPDGRMIAFTGILRGGEEEIFVMRADGTGLRRLTRRPGGDAQPSWSPDGKRIVFVRSTGNDGAGKVALYVVPSAGGTPRRIKALPSPSGNGWVHPAWAPGRWIAFDGIGLISATGKSGGRATRPPALGRDEQADWAPDGRHFAFVRVGGGCCAFGYVSIGSRGSSSVRETTAALSSPSWSPDGSRIAGVLFDPSGPGVAIVTMRPDGSDLRVVTDIPYPGVVYRATAIDWGPAG
jgi:Tol biopolymer transport system component